MADSQRKSREPTQLRGVTASRLGGSKAIVDIDPQTGRVQALIVPSLPAIWVFWHVRRCLSFFQL